MFFLKIITQRYLGVKYNIRAGFKNSTGETARGAEGKWREVKGGTGVERRRVKYPERSAVASRRTRREAGRSMGQVQY